MLIKPTDKSHWYYPDGSPCHEVDRPAGGTRPTNLRDARKLGLYPSVTNVLGIISKPGLEAWKQSQLVEAAMNVEYQGSLKDSIKAIQEEADRISAEARERGTKMHERIEEWAENPALSPPWFAEWYDSQNLRVVAIEQAFGHEMGYGGRVDYIGHDGHEDIVIDWKTQSTKDGKVRFYDDWAVQLAAYAYGVGKPDAILMSVVISTTEDGLIEHKIWHDNEMWWRLFCHAFALWKSPLGKNYDPKEAR